VRLGFSACGNTRIESYTKDRSAEIDHSRDDLIRRFQNHDLLSVGERDHGIRCRFNMLDEIGVHDQRSVVDTRQVDDRPTLNLISTQPRFALNGLSNKMQWRYAPMGRRIPRRYFRILRIAFNSFLISSSPAIASGKSQGCDRAARSAATAGFGSVLGRPSRNFRAPSIVKRLS
jgi:hypothetical protein